MNIEAEIERQEEIIEWINSNLSCAYKLPDRNVQLAHPCFDLAVEHHASIFMLCNGKLYGSMYAMLRVELEAYVKGVWLYHVATDKQIALYEKEERFEFGTLIREIENKLGINKGLLHFLKSSYWNIFNSFTHTGYQAIVRRTNETHTGPVNYAAKEIITALRCTGLIALLSAVELSIMSDNEVLINSASEKIKKYGK